MCKKVIVTDLFQWFIEKFHCSPYTPALFHKFNSLHSQNSERQKEGHGNNIPIVTGDGTKLQGSEVSASSHLT